jgi:hypothetical protein
MNCFPTKQGWLLNTRSPLIFFIYATGWWYYNVYKYIWVLWQIILKILVILLCPLSVSVIGGWLLTSSFARKYNYIINLYVFYFNHINLLCPKVPIDCLFQIKKKSSLCSRVFPIWGSLNYISYWTMLRDYKTYNTTHH